MMIKTDRIVSMTDANQNFSKVSAIAKKNGDAIVFKRNKPKLIVIDIDTMGEDFMQAYEKLYFKFMSDSVMKEYKEAYKELAK